MKDKTAVAVLKLWVGSGHKTTVESSDLNDHDCLGQNSWQVIKSVGSINTL